MVWRTRSRRRGFGGSGGPLSGHTHGTRPPAGSVEWWPKGLASRMAISRVLEGNIRDRHQAPQLPQSDTPDGLHRSRGRTCGRLPQALATVGPSWLTSDHYFKAELERLVCRQVVAGPRSEPSLAGRFKVAGPLSSRLARQHLGL